MRVIKPLFISILAIFVLISHAFASYTVNIDAAKDLISVGKYHQAVLLLEEAVDERPEGSEGHYLLGVAMLWTGECDLACGRFKEALKLDPSLQPKMREQIKERIFERLRAGDMEGARAALTVAVRYDPGLGRDIAQACVQKGGGYLETGDAELADEIFRFISEVEPALSSNICELLYTKARSATGEESLKLVLASMRYGNRYHKETTRMLLKLANDLEDEGARQKYLSMADSYVKEETILQASVEYYTGRWGTPGKVSVSNPDAWTSVEKIRKDDLVRYLTGDPVLTRGVGGPMNLPSSVYRATLFPGISTSTETGYREKIWFASVSGPATVYYWFIPGN